MGAMPAQHDTSAVLERLKALREEGKDAELPAVEASFRGFPEMFYLLEKIGEGTFSCVYKAIDLHRERYSRAWEKDVCQAPVGPSEGSDGSEGSGGSQGSRCEESQGSQGSRSEERQGSQDSQGSGAPLASQAGPGDTDLPLVAIKRIHVTSSPARIANELKILATLAGSPHVSHVITAMRDEDQVMVVMQYMEHDDFRDLYKSCGPANIRQYMMELLEALAFVHKRGVIHRDIKPTNFLYSVARGRGILVDFGLAEIEDPDGTCPCTEGGWGRTAYASANPQCGYRKDDPRPGRRANRAGTRGFRAPEVLLKCNAQTTKIDVWSVGVILLMFLTRRFPFFNSIDDSEALVEIAILFGRARMKKVGLLHGSMFETTLVTVRDAGHSLRTLVEWCNPGATKDWPETFAKYALDLVSHLLELDYRDRYSAEQALSHPFFTDPQPWHTAWDNVV